MKGESLLVNQAKQVEPFRADDAELHVFVVQRVEQFLELQELVASAGAHWDIVIAIF